MEGEGRPVRREKGDCTEEDGSKKRAERGDNTFQT